MAYTLKYTNGKILLTLPDQTSDSVSTSLTLIGKNVNAYGADINQNYIHLLENFANTTDKSPRSPLVGQMWFDTTTQQIKVYVPTSVNGGEFKPVGSPKISSVKPLTISPGDFWYDSVAQQLKFQADASSDPVVIGPAYDANVGKAGWVNEEYIDKDGNTQTVVSLYANNVLLGIVSDIPFEINTATNLNTNTAMTSIGVGFNANTKDSIDVKWHGTATTAEALVDSDGNEFGPERFYRDGVEIYTTGTIRIDQNTYPLQIGKNNDFQFFVEGIKGTTDYTTSTMRIGGIDNNFSLKVNSTRLSPDLPVIHIDGPSGVLGFFTDSPRTTIDLLPGEQPVPVAVNVVGNMVVDGDLVVNGAANYLKTQDLLVRDKTIELNWDEEPGNATLLGADGGGIRLRAPGEDKTIYWYNQSVNGGTLTNVWSISDNLELTASTATFSIGGSVVLTKDTLAPSITSAPGVRSLGELTGATIGTISFQQTGPYETVIGSAVSSSTIVIGNPQTTTINFANRRLTGIAQPNIYDEQSVFRSSVATVQFVYDNANLARNPKIGFTIDVTGKASSPTDPNLDIFVKEMLTALYDPNETDPVYATPENSKAKVLCVRYTTGFQPPNDVIESDPIDAVSVTVYKTNGETVKVAEFNPNSVARIHLPQNAIIGVNRCIKQYYVYGGVWTNLPVTPGGDNLIYTDGTW